MFKANSLAAPQTPAQKSCAKQAADTVLATLTGGGHDFRMALWVAAQLVDYAIAAAKERSP